MCTMAGLSLAVWLIRQGAAALKSGGVQVPVRTCNHLAVARAGCHKWGPHWAVGLRGGIRSCERGTGPTSQAEPVRLTPSLLPLGVRRWLTVKRGAFL